MATARRVVYSPAVITQDTQVTVRCTATVTGDGALGMSGESATIVAEEMFTVRDSGNPTLMGNPIVYNPVPADVGTDVVVRCTAVARRSGILGSVEAVATSEEMFRVISENAIAPVLGIEDLDGERIVGGSFRIRVTHETPGQYDTIEYTWKLGTFDAGNLTAQNDIATYTAPDTGYVVSGTAYCVTITVTAMVTGTGTNAVDGTMDMSEHKAIVRIMNE